MMNYAGVNQGVGQDYTNDVLQKMLDFQAGKLQYGLDEKIVQHGKTVGRKDMPILIFGRKLIKVPYSRTNII